MYCSQSKKRILNNSSQLIFIKIKSKLKIQMLFITIVFILCSLNSIAQIYVDTFLNTAGAVTNLNGIYTIPDGVYKIRVQCWGGGGSGGAATGQAAAGGGGSGGAYVEKEFTVVPGQTFSYSVGNGGNGLVTSVNRHGGNTWFESNTTLLAKGGLGGNSSTLNFNTAIGASAVTNGNIGGILSFYGGAGGTGSYGANGSQAGGGGSSAGSSSNGISGVSATGGSAPIDGGSGASSGTWQLPLNCNCNGNSGQFPGGGGSGGQSSDPSDNHGGHGGSGMIRITAIKPGIGGFVFKDGNANCLNDSEIGMPGVSVVINPGNIVSQTDSLGFWSVNNLPIGNYSIVLDTNRFPSTMCDTFLLLSITDTTDFYSTNDVGIYNLNCPIVDVSIMGQTLRRCFSNQMVYVSACNNYPTVASLVDAYVDVTLNELQIPHNSSIPFTTIGNNTYRFFIDDIDPGQCINFNIATSISCAASLGQTLCMNATLFPIASCILDTIPSNPPSGGAGTLNGLPIPCTLPWDQSNLIVDGWCQNDSIYFSIDNTSQSGIGDMDCYSPIWITVDGVVTFTDSIMLLGGQTINYTFPGNGSTWILNASQHPLHPGNSQPTVFVEACGDTSNWIPNLVNNFPLDDADPIIDSYCGITTGSYDPNDKTGYPNGVTDQYYIQPNQQLQYVIRFQNTGTDTAFTVVIRDTLDTDLNIFSVTSGVSSHDYEFRMYGPRVLEWTFNNINLPDSTTDLEGSNGFVTFHVDQVPNLTPGTEITNDADIYFDFNDPITTNTTMHRIYVGFVSVAELEEISKEKSSFFVYPNPNNGEFTLKLENYFSMKYRIFDQQGREVKTGYLDGEKTIIKMELHNGVYYFQVGDEVVKILVM
jgi:uncharacterized repeat protein (TIGR01451 family)